MDPVQLKVSTLILMFSASLLVSYLIGLLIMRFARKILVIGVIIGLGVLALHLASPKTLAAVMKWSNTTTVTLQPPW